MQNPIAAKHLLSTVLAPFLPRGQFHTLWSNLAVGEEQQHFRDKVGEYSTRIGNMPKTYEQDGKGEDAIVYLHYFVAGCDWYITEKDRDGGVDQAYGYADLGSGDGEFGYISIRELVQNGAELDLYWEPKTLREALK